MPTNPRFRRILLGSLLASLIAPSVSHAQENKEFLVKAAFIYNFVKFVEWPGAKAIAGQSNIDICVAGEGGMMSTGSVFQAASTGKLKLSLVAEANAASAASHCHVLFIDSSEEGRLATILAALKDSPVLTVSDIDGFIEKGGMIGFVNHNNKIKLEVNARSVTDAGMRVDAQLLEIALRVINQ